MVKRSVPTESDPVVIRQAIAHLNDLSEGFETLTSTVATLAGLSSTVQTISGEVATVSGEVDTVTGQVTTISGTVASVNTAVNSIQLSVNELSQVVHASSGQLSFFDASPISQAGPLTNANMNHAIFDTLSPLSTALSGQLHDNTIPDIKVALDALGVKISQIIATLKAYGLLS